MTFRYCASAIDRFVFFLVFFLGCFFLALSLRLLFHTCPLSSIFKGHTAQHADMPDFYSLGINLSNQKYCFYACKSVLSLVFYRDSTKEAGPNYMFSDRLLTKWLKIQFRIGSLLNCLLNCADTTLVHPLN